LWYGLVGEELSKLGFATVDGVDISAGMLGQARDKGVYRNLLCGDLTTQTGLDDAISDAAIYVGSMAAGMLARSTCWNYYVHLNPGDCLSLP